MGFKLVAGTGTFRMPASGIGMSRRLVSGMTRRAKCTASSCLARRVITLGSGWAFYKQVLNHRFICFRFRTSALEMCAQSLFSPGVHFTLDL